MLEQGVEFLPEEVEVMKPIVGKFLGNRWYQNFHVLREDLILILSYFSIINFVVVDNSSQHIAEKLFRGDLRLLPFDLVTVSQLGHEYVGGLPAQKAVFSHFLIIGLGVAWRMYPVPTTAEKVVKNIVFQQILLNEVGQPNISN